MKNLLLSVFALSLFAMPVTAQWSADRPDGHSPIQVMADHTHSKGEFMFSYRYMLMNMDGNGDGTDELSNSDILRNGSGDYMVAPDKMPMEMHMFGVMYAISDDLTLMGMVPYLQNSMDHSTAMGGAFTTESSGIGDISLSALYNFYRNKNSSMHWQFGLSIPTGSIEERDDTPMGANSLLPYPMQIGSGSFDFKPGVTYLTQNESFSFGSQLSGTIRLTDSDNEYRKSDIFKSTSWLGYHLNDWISPQISLTISSWSDYLGRDNRYDMALNTDVVHTIDPDLKAGSRADIGFGLNFKGPDGPLHDLRLAVNYDLPVYQNLDGPQMLTESILTFGLQYTFH